MKCSYTSSDGTRCGSDAAINDIFCKKHGEIMRMQGQDESTYTMTYTLASNVSVKDMEGSKADHSAKEKKKG